MGENWLFQALGEWITPVYLVLLFLFGVALRRGPEFMASINERLRDRMAGTTGAIELLRGEVARLSARVEALEASEAHWRERAIAAEADAIFKQAIIDGQGQVNQAAAHAAAEVRLAAVEKKERDK